MDQSMQKWADAVSVAVPAADKAVKAFQGNPTEEAGRAAEKAVMKVARAAFPLTMNMPAELQAERRAYDAIYEAAKKKAAEIRKATPRSGASPDDKLLKAIFG